MLRAACVVVATAVSAAAAPLPDVDPLLPGTKWVGTLTQTGEHHGRAIVPQEYPTEIVVTYRDGNRFEAELFQYSTSFSRIDRVTYQLTGTIGVAPNGKGAAVTLRSTGVKQCDLANTVTGVLYAGQLVGKSLRGTWRAPPVGPGTWSEGAFVLTLKR